MNVINSSSTFSIPSQFSSSSQPTSEAVALCVLSGHQDGRRWRRCCIPNTWKYCWFLVDENLRYINIVFFLEWNAMPLQHSHQTRSLLRKYVYTAHTFRIIMSNYDYQFTFNCTACYPTTLPYSPATYHTVRRVFLFPIDINSCPVLPTVPSQLSPLRDVFKFLAAKTLLERGELKMIAWQWIRLICIK